MWTITSCGVSGGLHTGIALYYLMDTDTFTRGKTITEEQFCKYYVEI